MKLPKNIENILEIMKSAEVLMEEKCLRKVWFWNIKSWTQ